MYDEIFNYSNKKALHSEVLFYLVEIKKAKTVVEFAFVLSAREYFRCLGYSMINNFFLSDNTLAIR